MIKFFEILAKIINAVKTLIYVLLTMLLLTVLFGFSHLTETVMSIVLTGIIWCIWFLVVDFVFAPRQGGDGERLPSRMNSIDASSNKPIFIVALLSVWFLLLAGFSLHLLIK